MLLLWGVLLTAPALAAPGSASRLKDIAVWVGTGSHKLLGYGLVVGLAGTGDGDSSLLTARSIVNMLEACGTTLAPGDLKAKNVAAVIVTGELPPVVSVGTTLDVTVSSLADAKSLQGGMLLLTPLRAGDGEVYAVAQGPVTVGGFAAESKSGDSAQKNHVTVGRVPGGAAVVKALTTDPQARDTLLLALRQPDFTTALRLAGSINDHLGQPLATAVDQATVRVSVPPAAREDLTPFVADLEALLVEPDTTARVVINERTGTVVIGSRVRLLPVAVCQGGLTVEVRREAQVSQPPPLSKGGTTAVVNQDELRVHERNGSLAVVPEQSTLDDLVKALNALGVKPRDLIAILQALKEAGALQAELVLF